MERSGFQKHTFVWLQKNNEQKPPNSPFELIENMKNNKHTASVSTISFRIDIDFPNSCCDVVLREMMNRGVDTPIPPMFTNGSKVPINATKLKYTPTEGSVQLCLDLLMDNIRPDAISQTKHPSDQLQEIGVKVVSTYGLLQSTCHIVCEVDYKEFTAELVKKTTKIVQDTFDKYCIYHDLSKNPAVVIQDYCETKKQHFFRAYDLDANVISDDFDDDTECHLTMHLSGFRPPSKDEEIKVLEILGI